MATLITDPELEQRIRAQRAEWGGDRFDEVWEGTYMMTPMPNAEHLEIQGNLVAVFRMIFGLRGPIKIYPGLNVSDRDDKWRENFRCPDVAVVMPGGIAKNRGTYHIGGPDFVVEISSPDDHSRGKIEFYQQVGVRELMLVDRDPWGLELYLSGAGELKLVGKSSLQRPNALQSTVLPVSFRLIAGNERPEIEVRHTDGVQKWLV